MSVLKQRSSERKRYYELTEKVTLKPANTNHIKVILQPLGSFKEKKHICFLSKLSASWDFLFVELRKKFKT